VAEKTKVRVTTNSESNPIARHVTLAVASAIALGGLGLFGNWAYQGGLIKALGGVSRGEDSIKLETVPGQWSSAAGTLADGSIVVRATQDQCPKETIIVGGYCNLDVKGALQNAGLFNGKEFLCKWGSINNSGTFKASAQASCLKVVAK
jgi:hypothetical protein